MSSHGGEELERLRKLCDEAAEELAEAKRNGDALAGLIYELDDLVRRATLGSLMKLRAASDKASTLATEPNVADACDKIRNRGGVLT